MIITSSEAASWGKTIRQALDRDADDIDTIYLVSGDIRNVRAIHRLASKLEGQTHKQRKESNDKAWTQKLAKKLISGTPTLRVAITTATPRSLSQEDL